jgi:putative phosphoribosyl transferase
MSFTMPRVGPGRAAPRARAARTRQVRVDALHRPALLTLPAQARGLVVCAHVGLPSRRLATTAGEDPTCRVERLHDLARVLVQHRLATLFVDLLEEDGALDGTSDLLDGQGKVLGRGGNGALDPAHELPRLTERALAALDWAAGEADLGGLRAGLCSADVGAAVALIAATRRPALVAAVVGRSGRPDLAGAALARVAVPTLLIVGGNDVEAMAVNRAAMLALSCEKRLEVVPGAGHCFEEPGALETMAHLAGAWLAERLGGSVGRH